MKLKEENFECIMVQFQPDFTFFFIYDISSVLYEKISFIYGPLAEHTSTWKHIQVDKSDYVYTISHTRAVSNNFLIIQLKLNHIKYS